MSATLEERTVLPPDEPQRPAVERVAQAMARHTDLQARLVGPDGYQVDLPDAVYVALRMVVDAMSKGMGVTIQPSNAELTTQQAADLLHISRPTLVRLLADGKIPFHQVGRHRRVYLEDLLHYEETTRHDRQAALAELSRESAADGTDDESDQLITRH